jgi:hypothetical protein
MKLTDYAKLDYEKNSKPRQRMEAKRIINEVKIIYYPLLAPRQWISSFIINHSNVEMRNLFCFMILSLPTAILVLSFGQFLSTNASNFSVRAFLPRRKLANEY